MNLAKVRDAVELDLRLSPKDTVLYLEGKSDVEYLFALLGEKRPLDSGDRICLYRGVLIKVPESGSGSGSVRSHVEVGLQFRSEGLVIGIIDGDGLPLAQLAASFDPPYPGPLFTWKSYCIENLIAKTGWPPAWGNSPDWSAELAKYGPYVALNRVGLDAQAILRDLNLIGYLQPSNKMPLKQSDEIAAALAVGKARLLSFDVEAEYLHELSSFEATVLRSLDEAHALINGKWLFRHLAPTLTTRETDLCEYEWLAHARSVGGMREVREWWERVTGNPP
jgi:hypothetical protein